MVELNAVQIADNLASVQNEISAAARRVGRPVDAVKLVVITKGHNLATLQALITAGARRLGESYLEEAQTKIDDLAAAPVEWHMVGHIQSRKAEGVCQYFSWIHSLDSLKLARRLSRFAGQQGREIQVLLQANVSGEASKFGWPLWQEERWPAFQVQVEKLLALPHLNVRGLMTMPPYEPDPEVNRPYFRRLVRLQNYLSTAFPQVDWSELSMGMSDDYPIAIEEGATIVRVGTAIVGSRD